MDLSALKPRKATNPDAVKRQGGGGRKGRDLGPNPFLDPKMDGNLEQSYRLFKAGKTAEATFEVTVAGKMENYTQSRGAQKGQPGTRLTGDADTVVRWLRDAAEQLGIGVSIRTVPATDSKGKEVPGKFTVIYRGQNRKQSQKNSGNTQAATASKAQPATAA